MDNQHREIKGYRELTPLDIERMNWVKVQGGDLGKLIDTLEKIPEVDKRWLAIARTDLQKGLMALTRAIAKPDFF